MPLALIERASSSRASSRNRVRGWKGLGSMRSMSIWSGPPVGAPSRAGATAAPLEVVGYDATSGAGATGICGSGSRMSAPSPLPKAFLVIYDYLLSELCIALSAPAMDIIENNRLTETGCLGQPNVPWDYCLEYLGPEKTP